MLVKGMFSDYCSNFIFVFDHCSHLESRGTVTVVLNDDILFLGLSLALASTLMVSVIRERWLI